MGKRIVPVVLSGGVGVGLWPLSRELYPKQFLTLFSDKSLLQETALRVSDGARFAAPVVICNEEHRFVVAEQLHQVGVKPGAIILEPVVRNTAAACAVGALHAVATDPEALILVLPADHLIRNVSGFVDAVGQAIEAAEAGNLVTFGVTPTRADTGYGYMFVGSPVADWPELRRVSAFIEKPERDDAERYAADGKHCWNSGMFLFSAAKLISELGRFAPATLNAARAAVDQGKGDLDFFRLDAEAFARAPSLSIDRAVMEHTDDAVVVLRDLGWADVDDWTTLWDAGDKDGEGNVAAGDVAFHDARDCYVHSHGQLTAVVGLENAVVINTGDAVLVSTRDRLDGVKTLVERLYREGRSEPIAHREVQRPWGSYQSVHAGKRFQVKCLVVKPGARLSLQRHHHRAEHWVVVKGTALVTRGDEERLVYENESIYLPMGTVHRLENPGKVPLQIIEVQSGSYLGEDDIIRIEDAYGR